jgi:adenine/guanine phosphoribosyltransferase-like PRPP-binding protein
VLATGGTIQIVNKLAENAGYDVVGNVVLIDLKYVPRVENFDLNVRSVVQYE